MYEDEEQRDSLFETVEEIRERRDAGELEPEEFRKLLAELNQAWFDPEQTPVTGDTTDQRRQSRDRNTRGQDYDEDHPGWSAQSKPNPKDEATEGSHIRNFSWQYNRHTVSWELEVPKRLYRYYSRRYRTRSFGTYIADPFDREYVRYLIGRMREFCTEYDISTDHLHEIARRFVQHFEYASDRVTQGELEYPKFPVETLLHEGGDCEDSSIILGAILRELGYEVAILVLPRKHHMMLGVAFDDTTGATVTHDGTEYTLVETTYPGWDYGQAPSKFANTGVRVYPVEEQPVLIHEWRAVPTSDGSIEVNGSVANFGNDPAEDVRVLFQFETESGAIVTQKTVCSEDLIYESNSTEFSTSLSTPRTGDQIRGKLTLLIDNSRHDVTTSFYQ